jgi:hypothetical protein
MCCLNCLTVFDVFVSLVMLLSLKIDMHDGFCRVKLYVRLFFLLAKNGEYRYSDLIFHKSSLLCLKYA